MCLFPLLPSAFDAVGSGERLSTIYGEDLRGLGEGFEAISQRLRRDGSIVPRNGFVGDPVHRVDVRLQERIPLGGRRSIDGILELFTVFNRANYGSYVTDELSPLYGEPEYNSNLAYAPRTCSSDSDSLSSQHEATMHSGGRLRMNGT